MSTVTSIAVPLLLLAQGFTLTIDSKDGTPSEINTETIQNITFNLPTEKTETNKYALKINLKEGEPVFFLLADEPVITFDEDNFIVECNDFKNIFKINEIDFGTFGNVSGVTSTMEDRVVLDLSNPLQASVAGLTPGDNVNLYSIEGMLLQTAIAGADGNATLDLTEIASGTVCIISVNAVKNFKLYKK